MTHSRLKTTVIAGLAAILAIPSVMPVTVLAQTDVRQEDRREDRDGGEQEESHQSTRWLTILRRITEPMPTRNTAVTSIIRPPPVV